MSWINKLEKRWGVTGKQVILILVVFALTGTTVMLLKTPVINLFTGGEKSTLFSILYYILIFPVYILILVGYGYLLGMGEFFKSFAKESLSRFKRKKS